MWVSWMSQAQSYATGDVDRVFGKDNSRLTGGAAIQAGNGGANVMPPNE